MRIRNDPECLFGIRDSRWKGQPIPISIPVRSATSACSPPRMSD